MLPRSARVLAGLPLGPAPRCAQCLRPVLSARRSAAVNLVPPVRLASSQAERPQLQARSSQNQSQSQNQNQNQSQSQNRFQKPPSHKPPKRRLEAASQPLRNAPSSTRGPVLQCVAHTTAERYDLVSLGIVLRQLGVRWDEVPEGDRERAFVIGPWKGRGGAERLISGKDIRRTTLGTLEEGEEMEDDVRDMGFGYGDRGEIWVFNSGSFVTWGLTEEEGRAFLREVIRRKGASVEVDPLTSSEYEVEEVDFVVDPTA